MLHTVCWAQDVFRSEGPAALAALIVEKAAGADGDVMVDFTIWLMIGYSCSLRQVRIWQLLNHYIIQDTQ